jgi:hypothetical protein
MSYLLSFLVLSAAVSATGPETVSAFETSYSGGGIFVSVAGAEPRCNGISDLIFDVGGTRVMVAYASDPLPQDAYESAFDTVASWRDARKALQDEDAYVAFGLLEPVTSYEEAVRGAAAITLLAGALASKLPAIAMVIPNSQLIVSPNDLHAQAAALAGSGTPPTALWVSANPIYVEYEGGKTMPMVISRGLTAFAGREIELESDLLSIGDLMGRVFRRCALSDAQRADIGRRPYNPLFGEREPPRSASRQRRCRDSDAEAHRRSAGP